jgi:hypothetical protein
MIFVGAGFARAHKNHYKSATPEFLVPVALIWSNSDDRLQIALMGEAAPQNISDRACCYTGKRAPTIWFERKAIPTPQITSPIERIAGV